MGCYTKYVSNSSGVNSFISIVFSLKSEYSEKIDDPIFETSINDLSKIDEIKKLIQDMGKEFAQEDQFTEYNLRRRHRKD